MESVTIRKATGDRSAFPFLDEVEQRMRRVRQRAFELFEKRGGDLGHELEDWLSAEHEVTGAPMAKLIEKPGAYELDVVLPGFDAQEIEVGATGEAIVVCADHRTQAGGETGTTVWSEFELRDVCRQFGLPQPIDMDGVSATLHDGVLHVTAPKAKTAQTGRIPVQGPAA